MSSMLYALGRWASRFRALVLIAWIALLALLGAGAAFLGQGANASITIPGTESQAALTELSHTFPQVSGSTATIIVAAADGEKVTDAPYVSAIEDAATNLEKDAEIENVQTPFAEQTEGVGLSDDERAALLTVQLQGTVDEVSPELEAAIKTATNDIRDATPNGTQVSYGGDLFSVSVPGVTITEAVGVVVAFVVLILTLGSLIAAGMPLLIALLGVGISVAGIFFTTAFVELTSTTPMLALMLGLAVGIDYTLFIVSRHQEQLRAGTDVNESIARATATSGSAVVFAGLTVIIALVGLSVAGIPFLTALGVAAAAAVAIAVLIAVTLTPAVLAMAGMRILPRRQRRALEAHHASAADPVPDAATGISPEAPPHAPTRAERFFGGWVKAATRWPVVTILAVLVALGVCSIPAMDLRLALPNATSLEADNPARVTYELTGKYFGQGANGPLLLTGSIITSEDPLGLMDDLKKEIEQVPGVAEVPLATPNEGADTGILQVVPDEGPHAESTAKLVQELRDRAPEWNDTYGVDLKVTGFTAVGIDVSRLLMEALLPFGILVVGLSLVLLAMVFRSVWVPIKATLGYLLSVGTAFGAVVAVFQWGWFNDLLHVNSTGPVLSFMPIILMGVLFGLAMDYEVFLVSRIREEYVHGAGAQGAIRHGFVGSARVVTAAALIMFAVFAAFVPEGDPSIKVIALGLAIGVAVDAFVVRMTLVPAVLALLGDRAWWMPKWLDRLLPHFDVEGEGLARELAVANWPVDQPNAVIAADELRLSDGHEVAHLRLEAGEALVLDPRDSLTLPLAAALSGRGPLRAGTIKVAGLVLPERAATVRGRTAWTNLDGLRDAVADRPAVIVLDLREAAESPMSDEALHVARSAVASAHGGRRGASPGLVVIGEQHLAEQVVPESFGLVRLSAAELEGAHA